MRLDGFKGFVAHIMLNPAGIIGSGFLVHAEFYKQLCQHGVAGINTPCFFFPCFRQLQMALFIREYKAVFF